MITVMKKAIIIGSPGAGKSTFARKLSKITGLPLYYLDMLWHKPDRTTITPEEFDLRLQKILVKDSWIIDGNYLRTLEMRLQKCDTVFFADLPVDVCLAGAKSRIGKKREDLPWMETTLDEEFKMWIMDFPDRQLPKIHELLKKYREVTEQICFHSRKDAEEYIRMLRSRQPESCTRSIV